MCELIGLELLALGDVVGQEDEGNVVFLDEFDTFFGSRDDSFGLDDHPINVDDEREFVVGLHSKYYERKLITRCLDDTVNY